MISALSAALKREITVDINKFYSDISDTLKRDKNA